MSFFSKLFSCLGRVDQRTGLERMLDSLSIGKMNELINGTEESVKASYAISLTVLVYSRGFTKGTAKGLREVPEQFKSGWIFDHDKVFVEVVAFYYFVLLREMFSQTENQNSRSWDEDSSEEDDNDSYNDSLRWSLHICGKIISSFADYKFPDQYIVNRAVSYGDLSKRKENVIDFFRNSIIKKLVQDWNGLPSLSCNISSEFLQISIVNMPIDGLTDACKTIWSDIIQPNNRRT